MIRANDQLVSRSGDRGERVGLTIRRKPAERQVGRASVERERGKASTFPVRIPYFTV